MKAHARIVACSQGGVTRIGVLRSQAPIVLRDTPDAVYLVGGAAGPIGGDDLSLHIEVHLGAELTVRSAAASVALPGPRGELSRFAIRAAVAAGGMLRWLPEPSVAAFGCRHVVEVGISVAGGGRVVWRDEVVLGREGEAPGAWESRLDVEVDGAPLLRHRLRLGEGDDWNGPAVVAGARCIGSMLLVNEPLTPFAEPGCAVLDLAGPGVLVTALASDPLGLRNSLDRAGVKPASTPALPALRGRGCPHRS